MITTKASLAKEGLQSLIHDLLCVTKSLLDADHLTCTHGVVRVYKPVLLLDLHSRFIIYLVYHDLKMIIFLFFDDI